MHGWASGTKATATAEGEWEGEGERGAHPEGWTASGLSLNDPSIAAKTVRFQWYMYRLSVFYFLFPIFHFPFEISAVHCPGSYPPPLKGLRNYAPSKCTKRRRWQWWWCSDEMSYGRWPMPMPMPRRSRDTAREPAREPSQHGKQARPPLFSTLCLYTSIPIAIDGEGSFILVHNSLEVPRLAIWNLVYKFLYMFWILSILESHISLGNQAKIDKKYTFIFITV